MLKKNGLSIHSTSNIPYHICTDKFIIYTTQIIYITTCILIFLKTTNTRISILIYSSLKKIKKFMPTYTKISFDSLTQMKKETRSLHHCPTNEVSSKGTSYQQVSLNPNHSLISQISLDQIKIVSDATAWKCQSESLNLHKIVCQSSHP